MDPEEAIPAKQPPIFGVLTKEKIKELKIIVGKTENDIYEKCYSNASFDFTLGDEYFFPKQYQDALNEAANNRNIKKTEDLPQPEQKKILLSQIRSCETIGVLKIPRFSSVIISTYESLKLPINVAGRFDLRIKWALSGLVLQVGAQIEPGYEGRLWGLLHNFSGEDVTISYHTLNHRLLTAEFYYTCEDAPPDKEKLDKPSDLAALLEKYPVKGGSLQNYFDAFEILKEETKLGVADGIAAINRSSNTLNEQLTKRVDAQAKQNDAVKIEITKIVADVQRVSDNSYQRRINLANILFVIVGLALSVGLPIWIQHRYYANYEIIDQSKELKKRMDSVLISVDTLTVRNNRLSDTLKVVQKTEADLKKEIKKLKSKKK